MNDFTKNQPAGQIVLYQGDDGSPAISVRLENDTVWVTQAQLAELFKSSKANISEHVANIFAEGELTSEATVRNFRTVRQEGQRKVTRTLTYYNLDLILSVGYRVKSATATRFRIWATGRFKDYLVKGYALNQQRLDQIGQVVRILGRSTDELIAGSARTVRTARKARSSRQPVRHCPPSDLMCLCGHFVFAPGKSMC